MATNSRAARARASVWAAGRVAARRRAARTEHPDGLDRDKILAATVRLLDSDGLSRFSMRRLAAELGVTAMSVYWYVDTKDDLLELALDRVIGELPRPAVSDPTDTPAPAEPTDDWRVVLRQMATQYRELLVSHPWLSRLLGEYPNIGPNAVASCRLGWHVVRRSGLPDEQLSGALSLVFPFVYGFATVEALALGGGRPLTAGDACRAGRGTTGSGGVEPAGAPPGQDITGTERGEAAGLGSERDFRFALDCAIAGIETLVARSR